MNINKILFSLLLVSSTMLHAEECDEFIVSFMVHSVDKWKGLSTEEIYQRENKTQNSDIEKGLAKGVSVKDLIKPYASEGALIVYACNGKSKTIEVRNLLSDAPEQSDYFLTLSKKKFFKLVDANSSKPVLKKVYNLRLIP